MGLKAAESVGEMLHHKIPLSGEVSDTKKKMAVSKEEWDLMTEFIWRMKKKENKELNRIPDSFICKNGQIN